MSVILLLISFGFGLSLFKTQPTPRNPSTFRGDYDYNRTSTVEESDLSFAELKKILSEKQFSKIEDLLLYLKEIKSDYMSRYALAYASLSLHESSPEFPRAIVYGKSGRFMITFNGHPNQRGYEFLETMNFNEDTKKFEFIEIEFNEKNQLKTPFLISEAGGPNRKCLGCHMQSRPIWNHYSIWPGMYGSSDDHPFDPSNKSKGKSIFGPTDTLETNNWEKFRQGNFLEGRYAGLGSLSKSLYINRARPNTDLTILLSQMNKIRIQGILEKHIQSAEARYGMLYALNCEEAVDPNSPLGKKYAAFKATAKMATVQYENGVVAQHAKELGLSNRQILKEVSPDYTYQKALKAAVGNDDKFFEIFTANASDTYFLIENPAPDAFILFMVSEVMPKAMVEQWPLQFSPGVYRFDNGLEASFGEFFKDAIRKTAFNDPSPEDQELMKKLGSTKGNSPYSYKAQGAQEIALAQEHKRLCDDLYNDKVKPR